jgi:lipid-A-disaccharide synthase
MEAAVLGCPMVIIYRGSRLTYAEYRLLGRGIRFIGMPNIIADEQICPELVQDDASPARIAQLMEPLIEDTHERAAMLDGLAEVKDVLGSPGAVDRTAGAVLDMLAGEQ